MELFGPIPSERPPHDCCVPLHAVRISEAAGISGGRDAGRKHSIVGIASWCGGVSLELVGGALLLVGLFTRPVAFVMSGLMAAAYFMGHAAQGFWPVLNGGAPAVFFWFLWLYISAAGPGPWSIDALRGGESRTL